MELLFVYGTLRSGGEAHGFLRRCGPVGSADVEGILYDCGGFPALVTGFGGRVSGEIWRCPPETLARLDAYEGVDEGLFERTRVVAGGEECWTYVAGPALRPRLAGCSRIDSGTWTVIRNDP